MAVFFCMVSVVAGQHFSFIVSVVGFSMVSVVARNVLFLFMVSVVFLFFLFFLLNGFQLLQDRGCLSDGNRKTNNHQDVSVTN